MPRSAQTRHGKLVALYKKVYICPVNKLGVGIADAELQISGRDEVIYRRPNDDEFNPRYRPGYSSN